MKNIKICKDTFRFENDNVVILFVHNKLNIMSKNNSKIDLIIDGKFIEESIDEHFCVEIIEEKIGNKETYLERKKEDIDQIVNFIHNGLLKK